MFRKILAVTLMICVISMSVTPTAGAASTQAPLQIEQPMSLQGWLDTVADLLHQLDRVLDNLAQVTEHFSESGESESGD
ncbi:hypothetical protein [Haladaptatus halobius]|uniref:hypothetical protein n=1 Tax=Haladaptatus halobius TaxID=2884875 RepID=UPI001D0A6A04|nr:hypothetical protein [Haladaptatus halobius]